ncbi:PREDICTED: non-syndromic hearing impairment protein 5 [Galeopterus variegatus]|uniref:Non-syndromic hearing impairment protein 5 n=1 Tax=Galeopterus variegatus TaxID=482537 RepID=A0ABM0SFQ1_GALVR|nr:PREDICTED: non-syndromic hearing impairment protein 5 [Galeopterus variegatus]
MQYWGERSRLIRTSTPCLKLLPSSCPQTHSCFSQTVPNYTLCLMRAHFLQEPHHPMVPLLGTINLKNPVLQQVLERRSDVLCILTQKIVTTQKCVISEHMQVEERCGGMLGVQTKTVQVSATEDGNVTKDSNVVLEIPAATTIAYGVIELYVKLDGQFGSKVIGWVLVHTYPPQQLGTSVKALMTMSYKKQGLLSRVARYAQQSRDWLCSVFTVTLHLERNFHPFVELPEQQQTALSTILQAVLFDDELLVVLEQVCDDVVNGVSPPLVVVGELKPPQQQDLTAFLQLVGCSVWGRGPSVQDAVSDQKLFAAAYFLVSALAEMPDNAAALLGTCCKLQIIPTLCRLLHVLSDEGVADLEDPTLAPLKDTEKFGIVQCLFASADISLERVQSSVRAVILKDPNVFPLILYITLNGLYALGREH